MRFTRVRLLVDDFDACLRFYRDGLRLPVARERVTASTPNSPPGDATLAIYRRDLMSHVVGTTDKRGTTESDDVVITFEVESIDDTVEQLRGRGVEFVTVAHDQDEWLIRVAHFRDPDGHPIEINAPILRAD